MEAHTGRGLGRDDEADSRDPYLSTLMSTLGVEIGTGTGARAGDGARAGAGRGYGLGQGFQSSTDSERDLPLPLPHSGHVGGDRNVGGDRTAYSNASSPNRATSRNPIRSNESETLSPVPNRVHSPLPLPRGGGASAMLGSSSSSPSRLRSGGGLRTASAVHAKSGNNVGKQEKQDKQEKHPPNLIEDVRHLAEEVSNLQHLVQSRIKNSSSSSSSSAPRSLLQSDSVEMRLAIGELGTNLRRELALKVGISISNTFCMVLYLRGV